MAVRVVDEEQEQREHEEAREAMLEDQNTHSFAVSSKSAANVQLGKEETNHDSALAAYDPYQTNLYKGVKLQDDEDRKNDVGYFKLDLFCYLFCGADVVGICCYGSECSL